MNGRSRTHTCYVRSLEDASRGQVLALATVGATTAERRRLVMWLSGIALLFLLVALGAATPFYRLWWSVMPFMKQVRSPGMALYVVALVLAVLAAFGADGLERGRGHKPSPG